MKCKIFASILAFLLVFQFTTPIYADTLEAPEDASGAPAVEEVPDLPLPAYAPEAPGGGEAAIGGDAGGVAIEEVAAVAAGGGEGASVPAAQAIQEAQSAVATLANTVNVSFKITGLKIANGFLEEDEWAFETLVLDDTTDVMTASFEFFADNAATFSYVAFGTFLDSITYDGVTLAGGSSGTSYSYWEFYHNNSPSWNDPATILAQDGDTWEWRFNDGAQVAFASQALEIKITGVEKVGDVNVYVPWLAPTKFYDTSVDVLTATCAVLDRSSLTYSLQGTPPSQYLHSITKGSITLATTSSPPWNWWEFLVDGVSSWDAAADLQAQAGALYEFKYAMSGDDAPVEVAPDPNAPRPNYTSDNSGFVADRVVSSPTPNSAANTELSFKTFLKDPDDWGTNISDILLVNNNIYMAIGQDLIIFDGASGAKIKEVKMVNSIGYTCRPLYTHGLIIVPLNGGILQAFTADALICVWVTEALPTTPNGSHQNISTLVEKNGYLYYGTAVADWVTTYSGTLICIDVLTGAVVWKDENQSSGYYWSGAVVVGDFVYIADNAGRLASYHATEGWWTWESCDLGVRIRSTLVSDGTYLYASDYDGTLWRIALGAWGAMELRGSVAFAVKSASTPVISDGKLFIGGMTAGYTGVLAVIDLASFTLERSISAPAEVQCAPLVVKQGTNTFVYFTYNDMPGGVYCYRLGDAAAVEIFTPKDDDANYCNATLVAAANGFLYYTNDSGQLFALSLTEGTIVDPDDGTGGDGEGDGSGGDGAGGGDGGDGVGGGGSSIPSGGTAVFVSVDATTTGAAAKAAETPEAQNASATGGGGGTSGSGGSSPSGSATGGITAELVPEGQPDGAASLPVLPLAGISLAVAGLLVAAVWFVRSRSFAGTKVV
ncbi:MAG: PQQ-binding-like beta-propeller repeat protein [Coriobacteriia bacterium]|nr:PQQ-binding-like beta-propeller repeat protein [Coriobacteriia bacterium]